MEETNSNSTLDDQILNLQRILDELTRRHLDGINSVYTLYLDEISPPEPSDLECRFDDPEEGVRSFLSEALNGPAPFGRVLLLDDNGRTSFRLDKTVSLTSEELTKMFLDPILQMFLPSEPSIYALTETGLSKYEALLKPFWCLGMVAVSVKNRWFMLVGEWSD